jgi:hypothetical protein
MKAYNIEKNWNAFSEAEDYFFEIVAALKSADMAHAPHSHIENMLSRDGNELLRKLFQGYLDRRSSEEKTLDSVAGEGGILLTYRRRGCLRKLETLFGEVTVSRVGYSLTGYPTQFPMDAELNLPPDKYSHGLRGVVAIESAKESFDDVVSTVNRMTAGNVPKRQVEELTPVLTRQFDDFYDNRILSEGREVKSFEDILVLTTDGKGVVMTEDSLREITRKNAQQAKAKKGKRARLSPGEKGNRKRNATVAAVYYIAPHIRTHEQILHRDKDDATMKKRPKPYCKRAWASVEKDMEEVIESMFEEAQRRDPCHQLRWVVLIDGLPSQRKCVERIGKRYRPDIAVTVDFVHVAEYVWKAAYCFYKVGSDEAEQWVSEKLKALLEGKAGLVAGAIGRKATRLDLTEKQRENADKCIEYLKKLKSLMKYDISLKEGFPIATGVIEGACRYLVKDRMDKTGARWGLERAEAILKLRALYTSGDLDEYLDFHFRKEQERIYPNSSRDLNRLRIAK